MKRTLLLMLALFVLLIHCGQESAEKFTFEPTAPQAGETITVRFRPGDGPLAKAQQVTMVVYEFADKLPMAKESELLKRGRNLIGKFVVDSTTKAIFVQFEAGDYTDTNDEKGYYILLHDKEGKVVEGAYAALARIQNGDSFPLDLEGDPEEAFSSLRQEYTVRPGSEDLYRDIKWSIMINFDNIDSTKKVLSELHQLSQASEPTLDELKLMATWFARLDLTKEAEVYENKVLASEPYGELAEDRQYGAFLMARGIRAKLQKFIEFQHKFPSSNELNRMTRLMLDEYIGAKQYDSALEFLEKVSKSTNSQHYNQLAWTMCENGINLNTSNALAKKAVDLARNRLAASPQDKPSYITERRWNQNLRQTLGGILDTHGFINYKLENYQDAVTMLSEAVELTNSEQGDINERYVHTLLALDKNDKAYEFLDKLIRTNKRTPVIDDLFKQAYIAKHGSDEGLETILKEAEQQSLINLEAEISKKMVDYPAPDFHLSDLENNELTLHDLKGKVVVLDFWATWCAPCLQSMPGMQKIVDQFKGDETVEFLFINAWERGDEKEVKVKQFMQNKGYDMHVLMDTENHAIHEYKVEGIPTKFIIDGKGHVRFKLVGFDGNENTMIRELNLMIDMVR
ncbi:redoxin domain-containing protein [candidate division KSB1 bacterium]|nr:redoxin domain-containing protein [candidate division KSB1 bacterium]